VIPLGYDGDKRECYYYSNGWSGEEENGKVSGGRGKWCSLESLHSPHNPQLPTTI